MSDNSNVISKKQVGKLIPYPVIENGRKILNFGPTSCRVCGSGIRRLKDTGYGFPVLERLQVVGGLRRFADACPVCHSSSRERLIWFWMSEANRGFRFAKDTTIAHFAPEKGLSMQMARCVGENYTAYDFEPSRYRHLKRVEQADLSNLTIKDDSVDLLVCNHVIEHVPNVGQALAEIFRVTKPGGVAILQVPIALNLASTIELALDSTAEERVDLLGQDDHLRLFTQDGYLGALEEAGFEVELFDPFEMSAKTATEWTLDPFEKLHICRKP